MHKAWKISIKITWWSASGLKVPNSSILREDDKTYIIRKRAGYSDKIMIKILKESKNYSIIDNYSTLELKEMGYSVEEIANYVVSTIGLPFESLNFEKLKEMVEQYKEQGLNDAYTTIKKNPHNVC